MKVPRSIWIHAGLVVGTAAFATWAWSRDRTPEGFIVEVPIWGGRPSEVKSVELAMKGKTVRLEPRKDERGSWLFGTIEKDPVNAPPTAKVVDDKNPNKKPSEDKQTITIVSVSAAERLVEKLAPFKAVRALGKVPDDKLQDFGLKDPDESLKVQVEGSEHKLLVGSPIPGASDRYVMDPERRSVFVIQSDGINDLESAEWRLAEHDQHEWHDPDLSRAKITVGGKTREVVRSGPEGKRFWADASTPAQKDEALENYFQKIDRMRGQEFVTSAPADASPVVRIDYGSARSSLGFFELVKSASKEAGHKSDYWARTEYTRLFVKAPQAVADQVEQDLGAVVR